MDRLKARNVEVIICEPTLAAGGLPASGWSLILWPLKGQSDVILANCIDAALAYFVDKLFTRDAFGIE